MVKFLRKRTEMLKKYFVDKSPCLFAPKLKHQLSQLTTELLCNLSLINKYYMKMH